MNIILGTVFVVCSLSFIYTVFNSRALSTVEFCFAHRFTRLSHREDATSAANTVISKKRLNLYTSNTKILPTHPALGGFLKGMWPIFYSATWGI